MLLTNEEFEIIDSIIPTKNYWSAKLIVDTDRNQIIATDWAIVIEMEIQWGEEWRTLADYFDTVDTDAQSVSVPLFKLKGIKYLSKIVYKMYQDNVLNKWQLVPVPASLWYMIGADTIILDTCTNMTYKEAQKIDDLLEEIDHEDQSLFGESEANLIVSKAKTTFDKVIKKLSGKYTVWPSFTTAQWNIGSTIVKVAMRTPVSK